MTQPVCPATWDAAFDTFRKYWNSCEENNIPPEFGRVFAIFSEALRGSRSEGPQMLCADWEKRLCSEYDEPMTHKDVARFVRSMSSAPSASAAMTPQEREHLISWHMDQATYREVQDDFNGAAHHNLRWKELSRG